MLNPLEVIWIYDETIQPPNFKMVACILPDEGLFFRINSSRLYRPCLPLLQIENTFLDHDSFLECNLLEISDDDIEKGLKKSGILGVLNNKTKISIIHFIKNYNEISSKDKTAILAILNT